MRRLPGNEGVVDRHHDSLLRVNVFLLLRLHNVLLLEALEGEGQVLVVGVLHKLNSAEPTHTQGGEHI